MPGPLPVVGKGLHLRPLISIIMISNNVDLVKGVVEIVPNCENGRLCAPGGVGVMASRSGRDGRDEFWYQI